MANKESRYAARGVSSRKDDVHTAIKNIDKGIFPGAFCKILPDFLGGDPKYCVIQHADGAGTKAGLAYLYWKLLDDMNVWRGVAQDSLVMNFDDMGCVGATEPFLVSGAIGRNAALIPGEVLTALIEGGESFLSMLTKYGVECHNAGGETADLGDVVRTIVVDNTVTTRILRSDIIDASNITAPALIVGFSSTGQAVWEDFPNSGIGSNGLTNARHEALSLEYRKHHETYAPETNRELVYCGKYVLSDTLPGDSRFTIGTALLSPTRTYLPLIAYLFEKMGRKKFLGLIHCSGGGQTKIGKFGAPGVTYIKNNLFSIPPLFQMLKEVCGLPWSEMYEAYNMGHRMEAVVRTQDDAERCIKLAHDCGIDAQIIGNVVKDATNPNGRTVVIQNNMMEFTYSFEA